jgi:uncharacterized membrane protein YjfL (UPF0719 family)
MNLHLLIQGIVEIVLSFITGLLIFFLSFKFFTFLTRDIDELAEIKKNNAGIAILISAFVFGIMLLVKAAIGPALDSLDFTASGINTSFIFYSLLRIVLIYFSAAIFSFLVLWLSLRFFMMLTTKIDEMKELKNSNTAIGIVMGVLIICMAIILLNPLSTFLNGFVAPPSTVQGVKSTLINTSALGQGLIQLIIALFAAIFIFFFGFKIFSLLTKKIDEIEELKGNNLAIAILMAAFIFSMMLIIRAAVDPANSALGEAFKKTATSTDVTKAIIRIVAFFILSGIFAFIMLWLAMKAFMLLTASLDEMAEIKNKNVAVAVIIGILLISSALILQHGLTILLQGLIRTPKVESGLLNLTNIK